MTIITPVFNGEKYIETTINSVLNQTYKNIEYIIVDGGSTDKTISIIEKYLKMITGKNLLLKHPVYTSIFNRTYM